MTGALDPPAAVWLATALVELTIVLAIACAIDRLIASRLRPHVRHGLWTLVAIRVLLPPGLVRWPGGAPGEIAIDASILPAASLPASSLAAGVLFACWALGATVLLTRWWLQARRVERRLMAAAPRIGDEDGAEILRGRLAGLARRVRLSRLPAVYLDSTAQVPYVIGLWTPRLVVPADWNRWPLETLDHALAHELMHVRRRDLRMEGLWMLAACLYWFHPLVHLARRRAHECREMCCDAEVAGLIGPGYRLTLLRVLAALSSEGTLATAAPAGHGWHPAVERLRALERWGAPSATGARVGALALLLGAACVILPSHVQVALRADPPVPLERLLDSSTRQELGLGSLHLRYAVMGATQTTTPGSPPPGAAPK